MTTSGLVVTYSDSESLKSLIPSLSKLSAGTEMASYKNAQWHFLLGGGDDITAYIVFDDSKHILGCVLRINLAKVDSNGGQTEKYSNSGFGMMLVRLEAWGQGLARKLLTSAMNDSSGINVLAVCGALGYPLYRKLNFEDVGRVVALRAKLEDTRNSNFEVAKDERVTVTTHSHPIGKEIKNLFIELDKAATSYD